tara:strand:- start:124 stop:549 length:426 start_codon:yes stop_codon:yes gene_type:complete
MIYLTYSGYNYSKRRCESIVNWFVDTYLPNYKLFINVDHKGILREGVFGWAWVVPPDHRPREFEVEIHNRLTPEDYTSTLLHELWHVYQHVTGQLKDKYNKRLWKGIDHSETDYDDQPWEKEAHQMEKVLVKEYNRYLTTK